MKKTLLFLTLLTYSSFLFSQEVEVNTQEYQRQFEFNAGSFIAQFLNFSGSGATPNPYQATYRKL